MKRYSAYEADMEESPTGDYIRHDDPAIKAAVGALELAITNVTESVRILYRNDNPDARVNSNPFLAELRAALAGLKGEA